MNKRIKAYRRGIIAEYWVAFYLMLKGYRILKLRYKSKVGEVDILALKKNTVIAVEVKARAKSEDGLYAVKPKAQKRIIKALQYFMMTHPKYGQKDMRFDVIVIQMWGILPMKTLHLDNAWQAD